MYEVEHILPTRNNLGESPQWNVEEKTLYWVDIRQGTIYRFCPAKGTYEIFNTGIPIGALSFRASGGLVLATRDGFACWDSKSGKLDFIADPEADKKQSRFTTSCIFGGDNMDELYVTTAWRENRDKQAPFAW